MVSSNTWIPIDGPNRIKELVMSIQVDCYSGYMGEETPRFIWMATRKIEVKEIMDRWLAPDHRYFKILGDDNATYIIRHDPSAGEWALTFYRAEVDKTESPEGTGEIG